MLPRVTILVSISTETAQETYTIHSLINDLAKCFAGEFYYKLEDNHPSIIKINICYLSYLQGIHDTLIQNFEIFFEL